jgi:chromosome segregation ATPase
MSLADNTAIAFHEERINRLEEGKSELAEQLAEHRAEYRASTEAVNDKLDAVADKLDRIDSKLDAQDDRIVKLEQGAARWKAAKKALWGLAIGGAGVLVKELAMMLFHYFSH